MRRARAERQGSAGAEGRVQPEAPRGGNVLTDSSSPCCAGSLGASLLYASDGRVLGDAIDSHKRGLTRREGLRTTPPSGLLDRRSLVLRVRARLGAPCPQHLPAAKRRRQR